MFLYIIPGKEYRKGGLPRQDFHWWFVQQSHAPVGMELSTGHQSQWQSLPRAASRKASWDLWFFEEEYPWRSESSTTQLACMCIKLCQQQSSSLLQPIVCDVTGHPLSISESSSERDWPAVEQQVSWRPPPFQYRGAPPAVGGWAPGSRSCRPGWKGTPLYQHWRTRPS